MSDGMDLIAFGTGTRYQVPPRDAMAHRMATSDQPGKHLWVVTAAWLVADPQLASVQHGGVFLDNENLLQFGGPMCFKCEQPWSRKLAARACTGSVTEPQPWT